MVLRIWYVVHKQKDASKLLESPLRFRPENQTVGFGGPCRAFSGLSAPLGGGGAVVVQSCTKPAS